MTLAERVAVIGACRYVDEVIPDAPLRLTRAFLAERDPSLVVHGDDLYPETAADAYGPALETGRLRLVPHTANISTTDVIARVQSRRP